MKNIDELLEAVKAKTDWQSDYQIGKGLGYKNTAQVSGWRRRAAMPNNKDLIAMCDKAGIDLGTAVRAVEYSRENERPLKQAGFAAVGIMGTLAVGSLAALSLMKVTGLPYEAAIAGLATGSLYIMLNKGY